MYLSDNISVTLRLTQSADLEQLFRFQLDPEACYLAAFMPKDHTDREAYIARYSAFLTNPSINMRTIWVNGSIASSVAKYVMEGDAEIEEYVFLRTDEQI